MIVGVIASAFIVGLIVYSISVSSAFAPQFGNYFVRGDILQKYNSVGGIESCLHYPISNEYKGVYDSNDNPVGHIQLFEGGDIHWNPAQGEFKVRCVFS
jgi:uncharacterized protein with LGFP repeats